MVPDIDLIIVGGGSGGIVAGVVEGTVSRTGPKEIVTIVIDRHMNRPYSCSRDHGEADDDVSGQFTGGMSNC
jgi:hypothetical protein